MTLILRFKTCIEIQNGFKTIHGILINSQFCLENIMIKTFLDCIIAKQCIYSYINELTLCQKLYVLMICVATSAFSSARLKAQASFSNHLFILHSLYVEFLYKFSFFNHCANFIWVKGFQPLFWYFILQKNTLEKGFNKTNDVDRLHFILLYVHNVNTAKKNNTSA